MRLRLWSFVGIIAWLLLVRVGRAEEKWAEKLGYPPGKRVLILYANDMGALYEFNRPGQDLLERNIVQSAGAMPAAPWFHEFAQWRLAHPQRDVGVAISLTCPSDIYRWRSVASRGRLRSLLNADGFFWETAGQVATQADSRDVAREVRAQIDSARASGLRPTHLMTHRGALLTRPDLLRIYLETAVHYEIPAVLVEMSSMNLEQFREKGFSISQETVDLIANYPMPKIDGAQQIADGSSYEETKANFIKLVRALPAGITQVFVAPADDSPGLRRLSPRWKNRVWEAQLLNDPAVHRFLKEEGVLYTDWKEIMERFRGGARTAAERSPNPEEEAE